MVFIIDVILNHTSFDSEWIQSQPNSVFTVRNTPMLHTAYLVDSVIYDWGQEVKEMMANDIVLSEEILSQIETNLAHRIQSLELHQYFQLCPTIRGRMLSSLAPS